MQVYSCLGNKADCFKKSKFHLSVSKLNFNVLPNEISAIVLEDEKVKLVNGPVVKQRFGGYKLLEGSKTIEPKTVKILKDLNLEWDLFDSYYPPLIRTRKQLKK